MKRHALYIIGSGSVAACGLPTFAVAQNELPADAQTLLSQVRGLQLPADPSWWPPAPGWWLVMMLFLAAVFFVVRLFGRRRRKPQASWQSGALSQHELLMAAFDDGVPLNEVLARSSVLMRKVALAQRPRDQSASVQNDDWLQLLDEMGATDQYSLGPGRLLLTHPYQRQSGLDREQVADLLDLMRNTIEHRYEPVADV